MNGVPQAQMQSMQGQLPMPNPALDVGLVARAQNISEQQRQAIRMQQAGQIPMQNGQIHNSPPRNMSAMSPPNFAQMPNGTMLPFNTNANGVSSPGALPQGQAGSPRVSGLQQLGSGMMPQAIRLEESIRQKYPNATNEQVMRMISDTLAKSAAHQRQGLAQSAMNAAAGGNMNGIVNGQMGNMNVGQGQSPQGYAQMLRLQQEAQQKQAQATAQAVAVQAQVAVSQQGNTAQGHQRSGSGASVK
jgi:chromatin modification-related protein VID21